ncbi:MAG: hypothetical protein IKD96_04965 [Oscillospiraceae bacterium]|nr:hypothetical protein [Oscillospiraceae bacterium]
MKMKISELFDCGDEIAVIRERNDLFEPARIKELTMKKINVSVSQGETAQRKKARPAYGAILIAAILVVALIGAAGGTYLISRFGSEIIVQNAEEMESIAADMAETQIDRREHPSYSYSAPNPEQAPLESFLKSATYSADHWQDNITVNTQLLGIRQEQYWTFAGFDCSEGPLWKRHAVTSDGWYKAQYVAETLESLNGADPDSVIFAADLADTGLALIPFGDRLEIVKDEAGRLLGISGALCWFDGSDRYFQMEYSYEANAIDWGTDFVIRDNYDNVACFTAADGREFVLKTYGDRLWAECVTPNETYFCYGIGIGIQEAEDILDHIRVSVQPPG